MGQWGDLDAIGIGLQINWICWNSSGQVYIWAGSNKNPTPIIGIEPLLIVWNGLEWCY